MLMRPLSALGTLRGSLKDSELQPLLHAHLRSIIKSHKREQTEAAKARLHIKDHLEGEKCTKYFFSLEKGRQANHCMPSLRSEDGEIVEDPQDLLREVRQFYQNLYSEESIVESDLDLMLSKINKKVSPQAKQTCDAQLSLEDLTKSVKSMQSGKSPGIDGLTADFYKAFWDILGKDLLDTMAFCMDRGEMTPTQRHAVITCLYKKGDKQQISNWRPVSLLNVDYKIFTKAIANKIATSLDDVISPSQTASVPGRTMLTTVSTVRDLIQYAHDENLPAALLSIDQQKAFDRVNWTFMFKTLRAFGYGEPLINTIKTIYNNITSSVKVNGYISDSFQLLRGVRQGCPLSMLLYCLLAEVFANYLQLSQQIKGIKIDKWEIKMVQFADDTNLFLVGLASIEQVGRELLLFERATGARVNIQKCEGLWLGRYKDRKETPLNIKWSNRKIKVLGIWLSNPGVNVHEDNWTKCTANMMCVLRNWSGRALSLKGKRMIINQLLLSRLWYTAQFATLPDRILQETNVAIYNFLWNDKRMRVARNMVQLPIEQGGLGIINIKLKIQSLHLRWIGRLLETEIDAPWKDLMSYQLRKLRHCEHLGLAVFRSFVPPQPYGVPDFQKFMLGSWTSLLGNKRARVTALEDVLNEPLFNNTFVTDTTGRKIVHPRWALGHFNIIADICKVFVPGFISHEQAQNITEEKFPERDFLSLISCIPSDWREKILSGAQAAPHEKFPLSIPNIKRKGVPVSTISSKEFYDMLIRKHLMPVANRKYHNWIELFRERMDDFVRPGPALWGTIFKELYKTSNKKAFNIRWMLLHFAHPTMARLAEWGIVSSGTCPRCLAMQESHEHWFYFCQANLPTTTLLLQFLDSIYPDLAPFTNRLDMFLFGFKAIGIDRDLRIGNLIIDVYYRAVYRVRMRMVMNGEVLNLLAIFRAGVSYTLNFERFRDKEEYDTIVLQTQHLL